MIHHKQAISSGSASVVALLLDAGADPKTFARSHPNTGMSAIDLSAQLGNDAIIRLLKEEGGHSKRRT